MGSQDLKQEGLTCHTVSRIDDHTGQSPLSDFRGSPRCGQGQHSLNGDVPADSAGIPVAQQYENGAVDTHNPWTLKLSNMISAVFSRFSGGFRGGSV
jgi:hypothetical protein